MDKRILRLPVLLALLLSMSSCALLPEEEALRTAPLIETHVEEQFDSVTVERGDLIRTESVSCRYMPVQTARLSFSLGGEYVDRFFVQPGDAVEKGQLLAQLQTKDIASRVEETESVIEELNLQIGHLRDLHELELRRFEITGRQLDEQARKKALDALTEDYGSQMSRLSAELSLQQMTLESLSKELDERRIYAPFGGTITSVSSMKDGEESVFGATVITLVDSTMLIFRAETEYWDRFVPGDEYEIEVGKTSYPAVVTDEAGLGLAETEPEKGRYGNVYFVLTEPSFELEDGDRGRVTLVLDQRQNVLHVPENAVSSANGEPIVYYRREDGMRAYKPVETGLTAEGRVEIVSGLIEGEEIIAD